MWEAGADKIELPSSFFTSIIFVTLSSWLNVTCSHTSDGQVNQVLHCLRLSVWLPSQQSFTLHTNPAQSNPFILALNYAWLAFDFFYFFPIYYFFLKGDTQVQHDNSMIWWTFVFLCKFFLESQINMFSARLRVDNTVNVVGFTLLFQWFCHLYEEMLLRCLVLIRVCTWWKQENKKKDASQ